VGKHGDHEEILMRTRHQRLFMYARSALVMCKCGTKFELQEGAIEEVTCASCGEEFRLRDYRGPYGPENDCE